MLSILKALDIPRWKRLHKRDLSEVTLHRMSGALTNCIYRVTYRNLYPLLLRIYGANVDELIDRDHELQTLQRLSRQKIGPKLLGCFTNGRFEEFLNNSITLTRDQIRERKISRMIARRMKQLHYGITLSPEEVKAGPNSWQLIEKWIPLVDKICAGTSPEQQKAAFLVDWPTYRKLIAIYKEWLYARYNGQIQSMLKFCHNDTQYGNLLFYNKFDQLPIEEDDDSMEDITEQAATLSLDDQPILPLVTDLNLTLDKSLVVIDFEYSGQNLPAYDIANHFCEWMYNYSDAAVSYETDDSKYPTREERINFLHSYVNYVPGSQTPAPDHKSRSSSVVNLHKAELPTRVVRLFNETIIWRSTCCIFWSLWAIISRGSLLDEPEPLPLEPYTETGIQGEVYQITVEQDSGSPDPENPEEEMLEDTADDEFDHRKFTLGKVGVVVGDLIQLKLIKPEIIDRDQLGSIKYLDCELL